MNTCDRFVLVLSLLALAPSASAGQPKYRIHWLLGHRNLDYFEEAAKNFKAAVESRSHGDIAVDIMTATDDNGTEVPTESAVIPDKVSKGEIEMGHSFVDVMGARDPQLYAFEAPFLFRGYRHMEGVIEGSVGQEMLDGLRADHMVGLSFTYSGGACGVATLDRPIRKPEDLKGLRVGVYGDEVDSAWLTALGATPVPIRHRLEDILPMVEKGRLDAVVTTWRNFSRTELQRRFRYVSMMSSSYLVSVTYVNDRFYASLPAKYQALLLEESRKSGRIERAKTIQLNADSENGLLSKGVRPVYLTDEGRRAFAAAVAPAYRDAIEPVLGKDLVEKIKKTGDAPAQPSISGDLAQR